MLKPLLKVTDIHQEPKYSQMIHMEREENALKMLSPLALLAVEQVPVVPHSSEHHGL